MSTPHAIQTMLEIIVAVILIYGFYNEARVIKFEQKIKGCFKRAGKQPRKAYTSDNEMQALFKEALFISNMRETSYKSEGSEQ